MSDDSYVVRVTCVANGATRSFTWELSRSDDLLVLQRSPETFPTRVEALFDAARAATLLELGPMPAPSFLAAPVLDHLHSPL